MMREGERESARKSKKCEKISRVGEGAVCRMGVTRYIQLPPFDAVNVAG